MAEFFTDTRGVTRTGLPRLEPVNADDLVSFLQGEVSGDRRERLLRDDMSLQPSASLQVPEALLQAIEELETVTESPLGEQERFISEAESFVVPTPPGGFTTRSGVQVSGATRHGPDPFEFVNPFTNEALSPEQRKEAVREIHEVQEAARRIKRERIEADFKHRIRAVGRIMANPAIPQEQKFQVQSQLEAELRGVDQPSLIDILDTERAAADPAVMAVKVKSHVRNMVLSRHGDEASAELIADMVRIGDDGSVDIRQAAPFLAALDKERDEQQRERNRVDSSKEALLARLHASALEVARTGNHPGAIEAFDTFVDRYESKYGSLPAPRPDRRKGTFNTQAELDRVFQGAFSSPDRLSNGPTPAISSVIQIKTQMDFERVKSDVSRRRREGNPNYSVVVVGPDGVQRRVP